MHENEHNLTFHLFRNTELYENYYKKFSDLWNHINNDNHINKTSFLERKGRTILEAQKSANSLIKIFESIPIEKRKVVPIAEMKSDYEDYFEGIDILKNITHDQDFQQPSFRYPHPLTK